MKERPRAGNVSKNLKNPIMVAAISGAGAAQQREQGQRAPLLPSSEKDHNGRLPNAKAARPKGKQKQVSSRYMSPSSTSTSTSTSSSRRFPSPVLVSRSTNSTLSAKRSQSAGRPRPASKQPQPNPNANAAQPSQPAAAKLLVTSTRSLSVSFQGEAFPLPISKTKAATPATPERRRPTPVRGGGHQVAENSRPMEQHRWPARTRPLNSQLSMSVDCTKKLVGNGFGNAHSTTLIDDGRRLSLDLGKAELLKSPDGNSANEPCCLPCDLTASDSESVSSSSSTSGPQAQENCAASKAPRGIAVSARFWQETNSRLRRLQDPASPLSASPAASRTSLKPTQLKRHSSEGSILSSRTMASPIRGNARPASPSKLWASPVASSSPSRGMSSPARVRSAVASSINSSSSNNSPSILCFSADVRRGKIGEDRIFNAHTLRLLHNRYVQWRFVNARADATCMVQKLNAERHLWNAWVTISELRHSIILKRIKLLLLRQKLKLTSILKGQMPYLEEWALLDRDHYSSLLGATEALWASTLRLPVVEKAIADVPNVKDAVGSAVDVMQAMSSTIHTLSSKVEETNSLVMELINLTAKERLLLEQCRDFLSSLAAMQVKDCSLRTQILQFCHALPAS